MAARHRYPHAQAAWLGDGRYPSLPAGHLASSGTGQASPPGVSASRPRWQEAPG